MRITVLSDNIGSVDLKGEWGLSIHIEYEGKQYLLDTGASGLFLENAVKSGIDISNVDALVLSHAHYDHTDGLEEFFAVNGQAPVYLSPNAGENCYGGVAFLHKYIGLPKGVVQMYGKRFVRPEGAADIAEGVSIVPHTTPGLDKMGKRNHLYVRRGFRYFPDDFSHEHSLVFKTGKGLVLMNSCSHSGPEVIVSEVLKSFPGESIAAYIGGLHLFRMSDPEVETVANKLADCGISRIITGHCTGQKAFDILKARLGDGIVQMYCGLQMEL